MWSPNVHFLYLMWDYYFSFSGKLRVYVFFLPTFHKTYLRKAEEKRKTKPFKRQPVHHQPAFTKKPFPGVQPLDRSIILAAVGDTQGFILDGWIVVLSFCHNKRILGRLLKSRGFYFSHQRGFPRKNLVSLPLIITSFLLFNC